MISKLKQKAKSNWDYIVSSIAPSATDAINSNCSHVPCPVHGGQDGYRVYRDFNETGGSVCNTCGNFSDGFATLEFVTGLSISEIIKQVRDLLEDKPVLMTRKAKAFKMDGHCSYGVGSCGLFLRAVRMAKVCWSGGLPDICFFGCLQLLAQYEK